jgi:hypothetical protein
VRDEFTRWLYCPASNFESFYERRHFEGSREKPKMEPYPKTQTTQAEYLVDNVGCHCPFYITCAIQNKNMRGVRASEKQRSMQDSDNMAPGIAEFEELEQE